MLRLALALTIGMVVTLGSLAAAQAQATGARPPEVAAAQRDLGQRLQLDPEQLTVERVEARKWPDASLGSPQPGMAYSRVITPGYYILLRNGVDIYEYHADQNGKVVYSSRNIVSPHEVPPVVEQAKRDLAQRLECTPAEVTAVETAYVDWAPERLGEPYWPDALKFAREQPGYRPVLQCLGREFEYATDLERTVSLLREVEPDTIENYRIAYLATAQDPDGFNLWDLAVQDSVTGLSRVVAKNVSDFSVAPVSGRVIFLRRLRGGMELGGLERAEVPLLYGPDFRGLSWDAMGQKYTAWSRETERTPWRLVVGEVPNPPQPQALPASLQGEGLPQPPFWQGNLMAFTFEGGRTPRSFLLNAASGEGRALPDGRFAGWLETPGEYLRITGDQLVHDSIVEDYRFMVVANIRGLVWARPLPGCQAYVALTQEGGRLRMWTAPIAGQRAPRLVTEMEGDLVRGQVSARGTMVLVQNIAPMAANRQECLVTLVSLRDGRQEPLTGMCPRAQLLPPLQGPMQQPVGFSSR